MANLEQVEIALMESEHRFYKSFHSSPVMMAIVRMEDNRQLEVNQKFLDVAGYSREEFLGHTPTDIKLWGDPSVTELILKELKQKGRIKNVNYKLRTRSGRIITTIASWELIKLNGENCRLASMQDITEKLEVEAQLSHLDRLNLIGEMAAGIGHEIRNPMTAVRGFLQMLASKDEYQKDRIYFDLMIEELDRANEIITEYLAIARDNKIDLQPQHLDAIVKSLYPMIQADANYRETDIKLDLGSPPIYPFVEKEIRQMILNLARNGLEAMSPGGMLTIGTLMVRGEIVLFVKDQGHGLDPDLLDKLGTPFITTKEKGTGLGLAICYKIAARHNAGIDFETGPHGTTFYVRFPLIFESRTLPALSSAQRLEIKQDRH